MSHVRGHGWAEKDNDTPTSHTRCPKEKVDDGRGRSALGAQTPSRARGPGGTGVSLIALQRAAGNRAVAQLMDARTQCVGEEVEVHAPNARVPLPVKTSPRWGATTAPASPTLFGRQPDRSRRFGADAEAVQRYTTSDSALTNAASVIGLGTRAAGLMGAVTFDSSGFTAAVAKALTVTRTGTDLDLASPTYAASGTVKASGPKARVGNFEIGFLQTVYESARNWYYEPPGHSPGLLARIVPMVFGERKKVSDTLSVAPVRDGDAGKTPWYGLETVDQFAATDPSTKTSAMSDTPNSNRPWTVGAGPKQQQLVKTDGKDRFRSWLAVKDKASATAILLNYADWEVDYGTSVAFNKASPGASVVTPTATSGSKMTGTGDGSGGKVALHGDPVANDVATDVNSLW